MSSNHASPPPKRECAALRPLLPLQAHDLLAPEDAERLRLHVATCPRCQAELAAYARLDAALRRTIAGAATPPLLAEEIMDSVEDQTNPFPPTSGPPSPAPHHRPRGLPAIAAAIAAMLIVALLGHTLISSRPGAGKSAQPTPTSTATHLGEYVNWGNDPYVSNYPTPQQAFMKSARLNLCGDAQVNTQSVVWVAAGPAFGTVLLQANCSDGTQPIGIATLALYPGDCSFWGGYNTQFIRTRPQPGDFTAHPEAVAQIPAWLSLPQDTYQRIDLGATDGHDQRAAYGAVMWLSANRSFMAERFQGPTLQPADATTTLVGGHAGWYTTENGFVTVTAPLDDGETLAFSGTAPADQMLTAAGGLLAHLDSQISKPFATNDPPLCTGNQIGIPAPSGTAPHDPSQFYTNGTVGNMVWTPTTASARDPRALFASNLKINMCAEPTNTVNVTWLTTSPTFGLALVDATCGNGTHSVAQITLTSRLNGRTCQQWSAAANIVNRPTDTTATQPDHGSIPAWLPLPHQSFMTQQVVAPTGSVAEALYTDWLYAHQTYSAGRYVGQAYQPPLASIITVAGHTGWVFTEGGYTTVTVPLPGDQTFFFGGTASAATIQSLASVSLAHVDDLFAHVGLPTPDPAFSC